MHPGLAVQNKEDPVRATYFGALDEEDSKGYQVFVEAMAASPTAAR